MWLRRISNSVARRGVWPTLQLVPTGAVDVTIRALGFRKRHDEAGLEFDRQFGIKTTGRIPLGQLTVRSDNVLYGRLYSPASITMVKSLLESLPIAYNQFSFIDFGSG